MLKKTLVSVGVTLILFSIILAVYVGTRSLGGAMFILEGVITCMMIICCPMLFGTFMIILSAPNEIKRKIIMVAEIVFLLIYGIIVFSLLFGGYRIWGFGRRNNQSINDYVRLSSNFVPFKTIFFYVTCFFSGQINRSIVIANLVGNLMIFMPTGLLFPAIFIRQRKWFYFLITITLILIGIELMQLVFRLGTYDVDDFILNIVGACLVYRIIRIGIIKRFLNRTEIL